MVAAAVLLSVVGVLGIAGLGDHTPERRADRRSAAGRQPGESLPDPYAWDPERAEHDFVRRAAARHRHLLYGSLARRRARQRRAHGALAAAGRGRGPRGGRRPRHARGRWCSSRAPGATTRSRRTASRAPSG